MAMSRALDKAGKIKARILFLRQTRTTKEWSDGSRCITGEELQSKRIKALHGIINLRSGAVDPENHLEISKTANAMSWRNTSQLIVLKKKGHPHKSVIDLMAQLLNSASKSTDPGSLTYAKLLHRAGERLGLDPTQLHPKMHMKERHFIAAAAERKGLVTRRSLPIDGGEIPSGSRVEICNMGRPTAFWDTEAGEMSAPISREDTRPMRKRDRIKLLRPHEAEAEGMAP